MKGLDEQAAFNPVEGENAALKRNNNDDVWVEQVNFVNEYRCVNVHTNSIEYHLNTALLT